MAISMSPRTLDYAYNWYRRGSMQRTESTRPPESESAITNEVMSALRRIIRAIDLHSRALVQRFGLTGPQLTVLKELLAEGTEAGQ